METRASYILVGAFVLALTAAMLGIAVWFAKVQFQEAPDRYHVYFTGDVTGLNIGSPVRYRGVPVGSISDIRIDPQNVERIRVRIEVGQRTPIKTDTVARITLQGITGVAFIQLSGGTQGAPVLERKKGEPLPVIASEPSALQRIVDRLPEIIEKASVVVDRVAQIVDDENRAAITEMVQNLRSLIGAVHAQQDNIVGSLKRGQETLAAMTKLMHTMESRSDRLFDDTQQGVAEFRAAMADITRTSASFEQVAGKLQEVIEQNRGPINDFAQGGLYELSQFIAEARILVDSITRVARQFERDPSRFLFGDTQKGFQPK